MSTFLSIRQRLSFPTGAQGKQATARYDRLDALRGLAMAWMTAFHFCFDLQQHGWLRQDFYGDPFWTWQRSAIVSLFLLCAGASQAVASAQGQSWRRFGRRWLQIAGCALLVTAGSWLMFPRSYIYFGVLHGLAVMLVVTRMSTGLGWRLWPLGALAIALPWAAPALLQARPELGFLNEPAFNWLGMISVKPITEDYVPLLPWLGVMWWGLAAGEWLLAHRPALLSAPLPAHAKWLAWLGGWSLTYYMLHQPVLLGGLELVRLLRLF